MYSLIMSFAYFLFCVNVLVCAVHSYDIGKFTDPPVTYGLNLFIQKVGSTDWKTPNELEENFEEGSEYKFMCRYRHRWNDKDWGVHWNVEPYGLRSLTQSDSDETYTNDWKNITILMGLKFHRDDQITIGCYAINTNNKPKIRKITLHWDKIVKPSSPTHPLLIDATNDAELKCYEEDNIKKCAFFTIKRRNESHLVVMQIYTPKNENCGWVLVVAGVAGVAMLLVLCFIFYRFIRKMKQNEPPTHDEPAIVYAELQLDSDGQRTREKRAGGNSHYAKILWFKSKKNEPKLKKSSENPQYKTEDTQIGTVEQINDLYSTAADTRIGTVERFNDLYSTAENTRIYPNRK